MPTIHFASHDWKRLACGCQSANATHEPAEVTCSRCIEAMVSTGNYPTTTLNIPSGRVVTLSGSPDVLTDIAFKWFSLDVANGDARTDTVKTYIYHFNQWLSWCSERCIDPGSVDETVVMEYRYWLVHTRGYSPKTIQLKLIAMRRFYHSAHKQGLIRINPVADVKAPPDRTAQDVVKNFTRKQAKDLIAAIPAGDSLKARRDRAMIALMMVEGVRRVSIMRANTSDLFSRESGYRMLVRGKGKDYYINLSTQTTEIINSYLLTRGRVEGDGDGEPLFTTVNKWGSTQKKRITRSAISLVTDTLLKLAGIKDEGKCCHALRHTCGHLLWVAHRDLKMVQMQLGHTGLEMASKYSHIEDAEAAQISETIPVDMREHALS